MSVGNDIANDLERALALLDEGRNWGQGDFASLPERGLTVAAACRAAIGLDPSGNDEGGNRDLHGRRERLRVMLSAIHPYLLGGGDHQPLGPGSWADLEDEADQWQNGEFLDWPDIEDVMQAAVRRARREPWTDYSEYLEYAALHAASRAAREHGTP